MNHPKEKILLVLVYIERRKRRKLVGKLTFDSKSKNYIFQYDKQYLRSKLIPLGPELPLNRKAFVSNKLFESFADRLPSRENPAYVEYCFSAGIDSKEKDPFILLTSIAKRGPSSFVFEAQYSKKFDVSELKTFRDELQLTTKEFSVAFAISEKTLISIEMGQSKGPEVMKRLELYILFPDVALFEFQRNCAEIHINKRRFVEEILTQKIKKAKLIRGF